MDIDTGLPAAGYPLQKGAACLAAAGQCGDFFKDRLLFLVQDGDRHPFIRRDLRTAKDLPVVEGYQIFIAERLQRGPGSVAMQQQILYRQGFKTAEKILDYVAGY